MGQGIAMPAAVAALIGGFFAWWTGAQSGPWWLPSVMGMGVLLCLASRPNALPWLFIAAVVAVSIQQEWSRQLPVGLSGQDIVIDAYITEVQEQPGARRLRLKVERCTAPRHLPSCERLGSVRVSAYDHAFTPGERWRMTVRLRPPSGFLNPHTFNYEQWLWREGIHATGYVRANPAPQKLAAATPRLRSWAQDYLAQSPLAPRTQRWLAALTLCDSEQLTQDDWTLLNATGTTHLVVISGLHVGLVASFVLLLGRYGARLITPTDWRLRTWPWWLAGAAAIAYAALAGLAPPAMRAMIMTLLGLWVLSGRHAPGSWQAWWLALALVLFFDPLALWRPGLWLSFLAVGWLILLWQGRPRPVGIRGWCWALLRSQLLLAPLMAAAVLLAFGRVAPVAPLVNLIAVPWVSSIMVPSALLGWLLSPLPGLGALTWWAFEQALGGFHWLLRLAVDAAPLWQPPSSMVYPLAGSLVLVSLCWGLPAIPRWLGIASLALVATLPLWPREPTLAPGRLDVTVYDVGQGQLVELRSVHYRMLYDTGPRFRSGFMPLQSLWPPGQLIDRVIVSHADTDHAGGIEALLSEHRVRQWWAPEGEVLPVDSHPCQQGQQWQQDGVRYRILWPPKGENALSSNDRSCVLVVEVGEHRLLLTGDVGRQIERQLLNQLDGPVSVLVAGHHGSSTSSSVQFVRDTSPSHVVFSAGRGNPFGHPADEVVRRFRQQKSCLWSTAHDGALRFSLIPQQPIELRSLRVLAGGHQRC
ncbi:MULTISPECIES: DNA internalization-related competence protein ComEC/Rec2 [unclassified Halomonas]|uniref:DNA internalization-related competence protein ComEC/Rec2 n=1 Tax=unclassified Halomonas TaxID=2609666 RepID=UPI001EF50421|nr:MULTISPECIES: DNA internalization-related competence protein ComEC/Rec2 [unclassified Halomonas]MCG7589050.1 DNA internalization-related competence protein ComEC/Rec2 [Halomonas sp. McD50-5]MCG7615211.1 DNA internalization-related competence protein ComEC/Rec2 [Halomonas sp. McD50-4]